MEHLTKETFKTKIFDYESGKDWDFSGELPCIIDFYADWCGPCKMIAPLLEELAEEYDGKINIFKVNTEDQQEIAAHFGITSIPSLLFIPKSEKPQMKTGAMPKQAFVDSIKNVLKVE
ncbi:thioredoxin [Spirochaetota bacterium]